MLQCSNRSLAHQSSVAYLDVVPRGRSVEVGVSLSSLDLAQPLGLENDRPAERDEIAPRRARLVEYVSSRIAVRNGGQPCEPLDRGLSLVDRTGGFFVKLALEYRCARTLDDVTLRYDLFFDLDARHQAFARVDDFDHLFSAEVREVKLQRRVSLVDHLRDYARLGVEHIFTGYDHLAFLFGLLVVAGLADLRKGVRTIVGVVTAFTVAHSITLIAAGLGFARLPSRIVEPAIAFSIAFVAVENLLVPRPRRRWLLTFGFGLVHGFGFASVLGEIGLPPRGLVASLLAFNVGVEAGQLTVVAVAAPLLLFLTRALGYLAPKASPCRGSDLGEKRLRLGASSVLLILSSLWFVERVLQRSFFGGRLG